MANRKSNPREIKMKEDLELLSKAILKQQDYILEVATENELLKADKLELLNRLESRNRVINQLTNDLKQETIETNKLRDFRNVAIPMIEEYMRTI